MPMIRISEQEFDKLRREHYRYFPGDRVEYNGSCPELIGTVFCGFTTDEWNHCGDPHVRYVVQWELKNGEVWYKLDDVCEAELMQHKEKV